jgi:hypothetical protein
MLFKKQFWAGVRDGSITLAFRRWTRPTVKAGGTLQSAAGRLAIEDVARTSIRSIRAADARAAGYESLAELKEELARHTGTLYRIRFRRAGEDPRVALRARTRFSDREKRALLERLDRFDARSSSGPWVRATLRLIRERPNERAADLCLELGLEKRPFKQNVRKLKALGLTESLKVGYRLSPRGRVVLRLLEARARRPRG